MLRWLRIVLGSDKHAQVYVTALANNVTPTGQVRRLPDQSSIGRAAVVQMVARCAWNGARRSAYVVRISCAVVA